jgi:hypothetical protein
VQVKEWEDNVAAKGVTTGFGAGSLEVGTDVVNLEVK